MSEVVIKILCEDIRELKNNQLEFSTLLDAYGAYFIQMNTQIDELTEQLKRLDQTKKEKN